MKTDKQRAAIYARVSTAAQSDNTSLKTQIAECRSFAERNRWEVVGEYIDAGVSGAASSRPRLTDLMDDARSGLISTVLISKLDRLGRSLLHMLSLLSDLSDLDVQVISINESFDTKTPAGRLQMNILASVGEFERARIRERMKSGITARVEEGGFVSSRPPFGYRTAPDPRGRGVVLQIAPEQAATIRRLFQLAVVERRGVTQVMNVLNAEGHVSYDGAPWTIGKLQGWLRRDGPIKASGIWRWSGYETQFPAILSQDEVTLWEAWLKDTSHHRRTPRKYLLSGLIEGVCGRALNGRHARTSRKEQSPVYTCPNRTNRRVGDPLRCEDVSIRMDTLDEAVWAEVEKVLTNPSTVSTLSGSQSLSHTEPSIASLSQKVNELQRLIADEYQGAIDVGFDAQTARMMVQGRREDLEAARTALAEAGRRQAALARSANREVVGAAISGRIDELTSSEKRSVLELLDVTVVVDSYTVCEDCDGTGFGPGRRNNLPYPCPRCLKMRYLPNFTVHITAPMGAVDAIQLAG